MNKQMKAKWVAALRSGEYRQTTGCLIDGRGHCCLGVLCDVMGMPQNQDGAFVNEKGLELGNLGSSYDEEANLSESGGLNQVLCEDARLELAQMNDKGKTFDEIADKIEENL